MRPQWSELATERSSPCTVSCAYNLYSNFQIHSILLMIFPWNLGGAAQIVYGPGKSIVTVRITFSSGFHLLSPRHPYEDLRVLIFVAPQGRGLSISLPIISVRPRQHPEWLGISRSGTRDGGYLYVVHTSVSVRRLTNNGTMAIAYLNTIWHWKPNSK